MNLGLTQEQVAAELAELSVLDARCAELRRTGETPDTMETAVAVYRMMLNGTNPYGGLKRTSGLGGPLSSKQHYEIEKR